MSGWLIVLGTLIVAWCVWSVYSYVKQEAAFMAAFWGVLLAWNLHTLINLIGDLSL